MIKFKDNEDYVYGMEEDEIEEENSSEDNAEKLLNNNDEEGKAEANKFLLEEKLKLIQKYGEEEGQRHFELDVELMHILKAIQHCKK